MLLKYSVELSGLKIKRFGLALADKVDRLTLKSRPSMQILFSASALANAVRYFSIT